MRNKDLVDVSHGSRVLVRLVELAQGALTSDFDGLSRVGAWIARMSALTRERIRSFNVDDLSFDWCMDRKDVSFSLEQVRQVVTQR